MLAKLAALGRSGMAVVDIAHFGGLGSRPEKSHKFNIAVPDGDSLFLAVSAHLRDGS